MYILGKNKKQLVKQIEKALQRMRISVKFDYSTISAEIVLYIFAIEQFRPTLCY